MNDNYNKIRIIGCSGAGKTFLSNYLCDKYGIPQFDLDNMVWNNSDYYGIKNNNETRMLLLNKALECNKWIIEGIYYKKWVKKTFDDADIILVLYTPVYICIYRVIKRFIKRKFKLEKGRKETFKSLISLIYYIYKYNNNEFPKILLLLKEYGNKVIHIDNKINYQNYFYI